MHETKLSLDLCDVGCECTALHPCSSCVPAFFCCYLTSARTRRSCRWTALNWVPGQQTRDLTSRISNEVIKLLGFSFLLLFCLHKLFVRGVCSLYVVLLSSVLSQLGAVVQRSPTFQEVKHIPDFHN